MVMNISLPCKQTVAKIISRTFAQICQYLSFATHHRNPMACAVYLCGGVGCINCARGAFSKARYAV